MTIDAVYQFVNYVANKSIDGTISPSEFNSLAPIAQMSVLNDRLGNVKKYKTGEPVPPYGIGITQKVREELGILYTPRALTISSGLVMAPTDSLYLDTIVTSLDSSGRIITEKASDEFFILQTSVIKPPTVQYPIFMRYEDQLKFSPTSITSAYAFIIRKPQPPLWNYTVVNNRPVYEPTGSQDFEMGETVHMEICMKILQAVGVNLDQQSIVSYAELQEQKGS